MNFVEVWSWGEKIGLVVQDGSTIFFELTSETHSKLSPLLFADGIKVKTSEKNIHEIGILADSLPGAYGMDYLIKYFTDEHGHKPSIIEILSFVGKHGLGALEFKPEDNATKIGTEFSTTIQDFKMQTRNIYQGEHKFNVSKLIAISNSAAGGARTKAVVGFNPENNHIYIAQKHESIPKEYRRCIVKYNAKAGKANDVQNDEIKAEYLYTELAKKCKIKMTDAWLFQDNGVFYFATERFDIDKNSERLHMHSFAGLIGSDASSFTSSYDQLFRTGIMLGISQEDKEQMFRVMVFNLVFGNKDDHARNFSFLMNKKGTWCFSPAYDLTFSEHVSGNSNHQLKIDKGFADNVREISIKKVSKLCEVKNPMVIISEILEVKYNYLSDMAKKVDLPDAFSESVFNVTKDFDKRFRKEVI